MSSDLEACHQSVSASQSSEDADVADPEDGEDSLEEEREAEGAFEGEEESSLDAPDPLSLEEALSFSEEAAFL